MGTGDWGLGEQRHFVRWGGKGDKVKFSQHSPTQHSALSTPLLSTPLLSTQHSPTQHSPTQHSVL
ncbi:hypothetical protein [Nostoc sp. UHCC 0870]|uniref:hypothetical protein n=1 Tax=Nostoc sp. UHCC 0870 TaxID=2914041 RepID=UPI001EDD2219|nr:hypothetical protein [Nostoc sp. UHCC 0870]UKO97533.1 hypothetical protein L6494_23640 [Nostoc sp. UHCC 0870]